MTTYDYLLYVIVLLLPEMNNEARLDAKYYSINRLVKLGAGGKHGDLFRIILFFMEHQALSGVINCSTPAPVFNGRSQ